MGSPWLAHGVVRAEGWESADTDIPCPVQHRIALLLLPSWQPPGPPPPSSHPRWFQGCLTSCPIHPIHSAGPCGLFPLAVPGPGAQWQKTKSSRLALDSTSMGTCPSRPSRWPQHPWELRAGKEEAWCPDQACPDVASSDPGIFLWTSPQTESPAPVWTVLALRPSPP